MKDGAGVIRDLTILAVALCLSGQAQAQVSDRLSRGAAPNAIERSLSAQRSTVPSSPSSLDGADPVEAGRLRAERAAREAADRRSLPASSTLADGPGGIQRAGSGASPTSSAPPPPAASSLPPR